MKNDCTTKCYKRNAFQPLVKQHMQYMLFQKEGELSEMHTKSEITIKLNKK